MIELRPYQSKLVDEVRTAYAGGHRCPMIRSETGSGKTRIFCYIAAGAAQKGNTIFLFAHRRELIFQISRTLAEFQISAAICAPPEIQRLAKLDHFRRYGRSYVDNRFSKIIIGSIQTAIKQLNNLPTPTIIVADEGHHATVGSSWEILFNHFSKSKLLPVTATPCRLDGKGLGIGHGGFADVLLHGPNASWLIEQGYLSRYTAYYSDIGAKTDGYTKRYGDNAKGEVEDEFSKRTIVGNAVDQYISKAHGLPCFAFCAGVKNARLTADEYNARGIRAASIDGSMDSTERMEILRGFEDGTYLVLTSSDLVGEGLDIPGGVVAQLLRPTESLALCRQQVGRILRPFEGKDRAIILDHAGNIGRMYNGVWTPKHGLPDDDIEWSLEGIKKRARKDDVKPVNITTCTACFAIYPSHLTKCPMCSKAREKEEREIEQVDGELVEISEEQKHAMRFQRKREERDCKTYEDFLALGKQRGYQYAEAWARKRVEIRQNRRKTA